LTATNSVSIDDLFEFQLGFNFLERSIGQLFVDKIIINIFYQKNFGVVDIRRGKGIHREICGRVIGNRRGPTIEE